MNVAFLHWCDRIQHRLADIRNRDYPPSDRWDDCEHDWKEVESASGCDVECKKCGCPGEKSTDDSVYWPAT
jgi:hypothetical protein